MLIKYSLLNTLVTLVFIVIDMRGTYHIQPLFGVTTKKKQWTLANLQKIISPMLKIERIIA